MTISINGICTYENNKPVDFVELDDWLKQREIYDKLRKINFFKNFFQWKTIKIWQKRYLTVKRKFAQEQLG